MLQLAEAYVVLERFEVTESGLSRLGPITDTAAAELALATFGSGIAVDVDLVAGSLRAKIKVSGSILLAAGTVAVGAFKLVANYEDFRNGIDKLCNDSGEYAEKMCLKFVEISGAKPNQVTKIQPRIRSPERIRKLLHELETLDAFKKQHPTANIHTRLGKARRELDAITRGLDVREKEFLYMQLQFRNLPPPDQWPEIKEERPASFGSRALKDYADIKKPPLRYRHKFVALDRNSASSAAVPPL